METLRAATRAPERPAGGLCPAPQRPLQFGGRPGVSHLPVGGQIRTEAVGRGPYADVPPNTERRADFTSLLRGPGWGAAAAPTRTSWVPTAPNTACSGSVDPRQSLLPRPLPDQATHCPSAQMTCPWPFSPLQALPPGLRGCILGPPCPQTGWLCPLAPHPAPKCRASPFSRVGVHYRVSAVRGLPAPFSAQSSGQNPAWHTAGAQ